MFVFSFNIKYPDKMLQNYKCLMNFLFHGVIRKNADACKKKNSSFGKTIKVFSHSEKVLCKTGNPLTTVSKEALKTPFC